MKKLMVTMILMAACLYGSQWEVRDNDGMMIGILTYALNERTATWRPAGDDVVIIGELKIYSIPGAVYCEFQNISFTFFWTPAKNLPAGSPMMHGWCVFGGNGFPVLMIRN